MTTKYKTFQSKTKPMSMFRYPKKKWVYDYSFCDNRQTKTSLVNQSYQFDGVTVDVTFYKGDEKDFEDYIKEVWKIFNWKGEGVYNDFIVDFLHPKKHFTVVCHNCELWGKQRTKKYVEIFPTEFWGFDRSERPSVYLFWDSEKEDFTYLYNKDLNPHQRELKTHTPTMFLLGESDRNKTETENVFEKDKKVEKEWEGICEKLLREIPSHIFDQEVKRRGTTF